MLGQYDLNRLRRRLGRTWVLAEYREEQVQVSVRDDGIAIPPQRESASPYCADWWRCTGGAFRRAATDRARPGLSATDELARRQQG